MRVKSSYLDSLYPNKTYRVITHIIFWVMLFVFLPVSTGFGFRSPFNDPSVLLYSFIQISILIFNHYLIIGAIINKISQKKWFVVIFLFLTLYLSSCLFGVLPLNYMAAYFPENPRLSVLNQTFYIHSFWDLFSLQNFMWTLSYVLFYQPFIVLIKLLKSNYESNKRNIQLLTLNNNLEVGFLRSQIQPHFLFNTLNNIYGMVLENDNENASQVVLELSGLLRFSLYEAKSDFITLQREIEFLEAYIGLEKIRHSSRLNLVFDHSDITNRERKVVPLLLVGFVENAFKHGVNITIQGAWVTIIITEEGDSMKFFIKNNKLRANKIAFPGAGGVGLANIKRRLELLYPDNHELIIEDKEEEFHVALTLQLC